MTNQHAIDHAEFDTSFAQGVGSPDQQIDVDEFVKTYLMEIIDEVFDDIDHQSGNPEAIRRLERLEIDLGEIDYLNYRQQMPQRLRRQLWQTLDNARHTQAMQVTEMPAGAADDKTASSLIHFLRYGYLPWYASLANFDALEEMLEEWIATRPDRIVELFGSISPDAPILERLIQQFSPVLVDRVMRLLESPDQQTGAAAVARSDDTALSDDQQTQLITALSADESTAFSRIWLGLMQADAEGLAGLLREIGQQAKHRQALARRLSTQQFTDLLCRLEPDAHGILLVVLESWSWLPEFAGFTSSESKLREMLLGYLLVERGARFDRAALVESLITQIGNRGVAQPSKFWSEIQDKLKRLDRTEVTSDEMFRLLLAQVEARVVDKSPAADFGDDYHRYVRLAAMFGAGIAISDDALVIDDIELLMQRAPWLMLNLLREWQISGVDPRRALRELSAPVLERLVYALQALIGQTVASGPTAGTAELHAAIRRHAEHAPSPQAYFAEILSRMLSGDVIDFDALIVVEVSGDRDADSVAAVASVAGHDEALEILSTMEQTRAARLLQSAELLTTAVLTAGLQLPAPRLQAIKWRFIKTYVSETRVLFNLGHFVRRYSDVLIKQTGIDDIPRFYSLLGQALLQNSLPATREWVRQMIERLDDLAAQADRVESTQSEPELVQAIYDERVADEDIHVANAGLVLLAPWLPRLFEQLGFVADGEFNNRDAAERAVHCLQYLVDASVSSLEFQLVLNKLLCGVKPGKPIRRGIELTADETKQLESLLTAITQHWQALENTSIDGLRESFLQRGGRLRRQQDTWRLEVEARAFDMLLDQIPWSYTTIKFSWMDRVIYVDWR